MLSVSQAWASTLTIGLGVQGFGKGSFDESTATTGSIVPKLSNNGLLPLNFASRSFLGLGSGFRV